MLPSAAASLSLHCVVFPAVFGTVVVALKALLVGAGWGLVAVSLE